MLCLIWQREIWFCRVPPPLPLPVGAGAHGGTWHAVLEVDKDGLKREMTKLARLAEQDRHIRLALERLGARPALRRQASRPAPCCESAPC